MTYSVVWIEHNSRHHYTPDMISDVLEFSKAVHLGCAPGADPEINSHIVLVPTENLEILCQKMSDFGQDAYQRVDANGVGYLTDDAGKSWYSLKACMDLGMDERTAYAGPLFMFNLLCRVSRHLGMLARAALPEVKD